MKEESIKLMKDVIEKWQKEPLFSTVKKEWWAYKNPVVQDEAMLLFKISHQSFFCDDILIPIELTSKTFSTNTLSEEPLSNNVNSDAYNLQKFLSEFDENFGRYREEKLKSCAGKLSTSDPLYW